MNLQKLLAENMLRFGAKNLNEKNIQVLTRLTEQVAAPVDILYTQTYNLATGVSDPSSYINQMVNGIMSAISANPEAQKMLAANSIKITRILIRGGASNSWAGETTGFDMTLDSTLPVKPTETVLFQKNKELAKRRADECKNALMPLLAKKGIKQDSLLANNTRVVGVVYNTGGKIDLKGQLITVKITLSYLSPVDLDPDTVTKFVLNGSYYTKNGLSSTNTKLDTNSYNLSVANLPTNLRANNNRLAAFEIKWNPNVLMNPYKQPWYRWIFIYDTQGKIERVKGIVYDTTLNASLSNVFKNNDNISPTDSTLKRMMDLVSPTYYATFLQPFI